VKRVLLLAVAAVFLVAGCGGSGDTADEGITDSGTDTVTVTLPATTAGKVYWLRDWKVWPVARELETTDTADTALAELVRGPNGDEQDIGLTTAIPQDARVSLDDSGELTVEGLGEPFDAALAQIVYTLTHFPTVKSVQYEGKRYTRADFEDQTPGILVESPLSFEEVSMPVTASGTANTFEATFNYELVAPNGAVVDENFVTATSGTGMRGTFEFTTNGALDHPAEGEWLLRVFERSAEDGSRTKLVEIPLRMSQ